MLLRTNILPRLHGTSSPWPSCACTEKQRLHWLALVTLMLLITQRRLPKVQLLAAKLPHFWSIFIVERFSTAYMAHTHSLAGSRSHQHCPAVCIVCHQLGPHSYKQCPAVCRACLKGTLCAALAQGAAAPVDEQGKGRRGVLARAPAVLPEQSRSE